MTNPGYIIDALRRIEAHLQRIAPQIENTFWQAKQEVNRTEEALTRSLLDLEQAVEQAQRELYNCMMSSADDGGNDCSGFEQQLYELRVMLAELRRVQDTFEQANKLFQSVASRMQTVQQQDIPNACYWLRDHEQILMRFEQASSLPAGSSSSAGSSGNATTASVGSGGTATSRAHSGRSPTNVKELEQLVQQERAKANARDTADWERLKAAQEAAVPPSSETPKSPSQPLENPAHTPGLHPEKSSKKEREQGSELIDGSSGHPEGGG
jgi:hypothetical protein